MNNPDEFFTGRSARPGKHKLSRDTVFLVGDLLPLADFAGVLLAAYLATLAYTSAISHGATLPMLWDEVGRAALAAAVLAPFILCERAFVAFASGSQNAALIRCFAVRFVMFAGVVTAIGLCSRSLQSLPQAWLMLWLVSSLSLTVITRWLLVANLRRLERTGVLAETVAVVGTGAVADLMIQHLRQTRGSSIEILGAYSDRADNDDGCAYPPTGSISDLVELGKSRPMDWILLAPDSDDNRLQAIVHRLKALSVPIGLCPLDIGGDSSAALGTDRPGARRDAAVAAMEAVLPRWIMTLLSLPLIALQRLAASAPQRELACVVDDYDLGRFTEVAARFGQERYGYVVTPNADHLIRLHREPSFRALYADAAYVLLDSRFISKLLRFTRRLHLPVCTGSDLTAKLFDEVIQHDDRLVLIGGSDAQAARLRERYGLKQLAHFNPPMGFIRDAAAVETCLRFVEAHSPFRYCLLAVGAPQQEILAQQLKQRGAARGMALCIGASISFLTGDERRAPRWMQRSGIEWLFRLLQAPGRMAGRYLLRGPQIFGLLRRTEIVLRTRPELLPTAGDGRRATDRMSHFEPPSLIASTALSVAPAVVPVIAIQRRPAAASMGKRILAPRRVVRRASGIAVRRAAVVCESAAAP